jgi:hypothetical protein
MSYINQQAFRGASQAAQVDDQPLIMDGIELFDAERPAVGGTIQYRMRADDGGDMGGFFSKAVKSVKKAVGKVAKPVVKVVAKIPGNVIGTAEKIGKGSEIVVKKVGDAAETVVKTVGYMTKIIKPKVPKVDKTTYKGCTIETCQGESYITAASADQPIFNDIPGGGGPYKSVAAAKAAVDVAVVAPAGWMKALTYKGFNVECDPTPKPVNFIVTAVPKDFQGAVGFTGGPYQTQAEAVAAIDKAVADAAAAAEAAKAAAAETQTSTTGVVVTPATSITYNGHTISVNPGTNTSPPYYLVDGSASYATVAEARTAIDLVTQQAQQQLQQQQLQQQMQASTTSTYGGGSYAAPPAASSSYSDGGYGGGSYNAPPAASYAGAPYGGTSYGEESYGEESYSEEAAASDYGEGEAAPEEEESEGYSEDSGTEGFTDSGGTGTALAVVGVCALLWLASRKGR